MLRRIRLHEALVSVLCLLTVPGAAFGLNPANSLTQYTRAMWTQADGLPQDTIRAIAQTSDGYLWLGTDEGISRFDGYEFVNFSTQNSPLPHNAIDSLAAGRDNVLWIATSNGLVRYRNGEFRVFTTADGLPDNFILYVFEDHEGVLWIASGVYLSRYDHGKFTNYPASALLPVRTARAIFEDRSHNLLISGYGGLIRRNGDKFESVMEIPAGLGQFVSIAHDSAGRYWLGGRVLARRDPAGATHLLGKGDGWSGDMVRSVAEDHDGNIWIGSTEGISRFENGRIIPQEVDGKIRGNWVRCMFEDREGNLWVGMNSGLYRFRDGLFTNYGRSEGMPSDEPISVHQDRRGHIWIGYHGAGLEELYGDQRRLYTTKDGLASGEILAISDTRDGDVLAMTRRGVNLVRDGRVSSFVAPDVPTAESVYAILEDRGGRLWAGASGGVYRIEGRQMRHAVPEIQGGPFQNDAATVLSEAPDGAIWAGTYGEGLWRIDDKGSRRFTTKDGLSSDRIRTLYQDPDGTLWIGTFGGGLDAYRNGAFSRFTARDGLLSDNIAHVDDDLAGNLWLATTRGICRLPKEQLRRFAAGELQTLTPIDYTAADGLRSAQCAPGYPIAEGGTRTSDGRIWFPTTRGLSVWNPASVGRNRPQSVFAVHLTSARANDADLNRVRDRRIPAGSEHIEFRYAAIYLTAPERVRYQYMLEGLDTTWSKDTDRRVVSYNTLHHGSYRFRVRASVPGAATPWPEDSVVFEVLPHFYERSGFLWLCVISVAALIFAAHQLRLRQIHGRFALVLEERTRIAREIHDTLAQGFVGLSSQLDAVALEMRDPDNAARIRLETARRMARHSLTEAKRSVMDLRAPELRDRDLGSAIRAAAHRWEMNGSIPIRVAVSGNSSDLTADVQQHVLRIAQEAVANSFKHAQPAAIHIDLSFAPALLTLTVKDDGKGFAAGENLSADDGHFGLLGIRERAERLGGQLVLTTAAGAGTTVSVRVPLQRRRSANNLWQELRGLLRIGPSHAR